MRIKSILKYAMAAALFLAVHLSVHAQSEMEDSLVKYGSWVSFSADTIVVKGKSSALFHISVVPGDTSRKVYSIYNLNKHRIIETSPYLFGDETLTLIFPTDKSSKTFYTHATSEIEVVRQIISCSLSLGFFRNNIKVRSPDSRSKSPKK